MTIRLAYGRTDLSRPRYDLALLTPQVIGQPAPEIAPGPERASGGGSSAAAIVSPRVFWIVIGVAAAALLLLIVRLLRNAPSA
jgi:predicted cobalt transporter CbtA